MKIAAALLAVLVIFGLVALVCCAIRRKSDIDDQDERLDEIEGRG